MSERLNISLSGVNIASDAEALRSKLETRLKKRLSMAEVVKRLIKIALEAENNNTNIS